MRILLVETSPVNKGHGVVVHVRNSMVLTEHLKQRHVCKLVSSEEEIANQMHWQWDFIIFISATFYFPYEKFLELIANQKKCKVGWVTNEVDLFANDWLKSLGFDFMISNFEEHGVKPAHRIYNDYLMTNLNALQARPRNEPIEKKYDCIQYSTYRKWRDKYYQKYLVGDMILSTSGKNVKKFMLLGCDCNLTGTMSWEPHHETLNLFHSSLYLEDTVTHKVYNHLANRFYEALYCNCVVFFDKMCQGTIDRSGYDIGTFWVVDSYDEIVERLKFVKMDREMCEHFLNRNTEIALRDKEKCFREIEDFLLKIQ